jgi:single-strand DNA-binding protein
MNSVNIIGNLTKDPELIETSGGTEITTLRVAINGRNDKDTVFTDVKVIGKSAGPCDEFLHTGSKIAVSGRLALDQWTTDDDEKRSKLYVVANRVDFLDRKPTDEEAPEAPATA